MALARERVEFHGETLELPLPDGPGKALKLTIAPVQDEIPIFIAAIGPKNTPARRRDRRRLDPDDVLARARLESCAAARGRRRAGGARRSTTSTSRRRCRCSSATTCEGARDLMRPFIALYVGGMGSRKQNFYNQLVQRYGFEDAAKEIQDLYLDGKRDEAMAAMPDELIDTVSLCGPAGPGARAAGRLPRRRRRDAGRHADGVGPGGPHRRSCASSPSLPRA